MASASYLRATEGGVLLTVRLQPRAGRSEIGAPHGDELRVRVTAPAHRGAANEALVRLLAAAFGIARSSVRIVAGGTARAKSVRLAGLAPETLEQRLADALAP